MQACMGRRGLNAPATTGVCALGFWHQRKAGWPDHRHGGFTPATKARVAACPIQQSWLQGTEIVLF